MKHQFSFMTVLAVLFMFTISGYSGSPETPQDVVEQAGHGKINWTKGIIQATGIGAPPEKFYGKPQARPMAIRAAEIAAQRNLLETVQGVRINSTTTVVNFVAENDTIKAEVSGIIKGAKVIKQEYLSDGTVEVTVEMELHGDLSKLILPSDEKKITPIELSTPDAKPSPQFTGLVVDVRGLNVRPAMAPKILDEKGNEVYGISIAKRDIAVKDGMTGYAKDVDTAAKNRRVTDTPVIIKGLKVDGSGRSDIVISNTDALKIKNAAAILSECKVMIVLD